jgi:hypothetical protein
MDDNRTSRPRVCGLQIRRQVIDQLRYNLEMVDKTKIPTADVKALSLDYRNVFFGGRAGMNPRCRTSPASRCAPDVPHDFVTTYGALPIPAGGRGRGLRRQPLLLGRQVDGQRGLQVPSVLHDRRHPDEERLPTAAKEARSQEVIIDSMVKAHGSLRRSGPQKVLLNPKLKVNI